MKYTTWVGTAFCPCATLFCSFPKPGFALEPGADASGGSQVGGREEQRDRTNGKRLLGRGNLFPLLLLVGFDSCKLQDFALVWKLCSFNAPHTPTLTEAHPKMKVHLTSAQWTLLCLIAGRLKHFLYWKGILSGPSPQVLCHLHCTLSPLNVQCPLSFLPCLRIAWLLLIHPLLSLTVIGAPLRTSCNRPPGLAPALIYSPAPGC